MDKIPHQDVPDENQIASMLGEFNPLPTARFNRMMQNAPWSSPTANNKPGRATSRLPAQRYIWGTAALIFLLILSAVLFIPSVRAIARQIIYTYIFAPSSQLEVQVTLSSPSDLFNFTDPANFPLDVDEAQQQAGFTVMQLASLPEDLSLIGARFDTQYYSVILLYEGDNYQLFLTQRPRGIGADVFSIGSDTQVKLVMIGNFQGELVAGGWRAVSTQQTTPESTPAVKVNISAVWDDSLPQTTLRWQTDNYVYELRSLGEGGLSGSELINLTNGLK